MATLKGITRKMLSLIGRSALSIQDLLAVMASEGYGASVSKLERAVAKRESRRIYNREVAEVRHKFAVLLHKLKKEGLVYEKNNLLLLTGKGGLKLTTLNEKDKFAPKKYKPESSANFLIVAYDIPGKNHKKRLWLSAALSNMGLRRIQQSVWMGKVKLPKDFLNDLKAAELLDYVEIFEITKTGTLREL